MGTDPAAAARAVTHCRRCAGPSSGANPDELAEWPTSPHSDHVSKSFRRMNRHARYRSRRALSRVKIGNSSRPIRMKNASCAYLENAAENMGKNDLFQDPENSKKSRKALSGGRYNLKHFVTATGH
ncbi:hypothetical protein KDW78_28420 [Burkholderia cenocepacia]|uniref:hypothetical protein n=1 Tax=Burkholderia cenocepacia TaxID=95486 RepID=UPI0015883758|nr:hypothetical protein [Burkholderia cenocepacia]MBR7957811.1 hypothetical protein [Burkholderia cenocepacia]